MVKTVEGFNAQLARLPKQSPIFGAGPIPLMVRIAQNEVVNRELIDVLGYEPYAIGLARNKYERIEKILDFTSWCVVALMLPIVSGKVINHFSKKAIFKALPQLPKTAEPLMLPFEALTKHKPVKNIDAALMAKTGLNTLEHLNPVLRQKVLKAKLAIMTQDFALMAVKGQGFFIFRNWLTEKLSGQKGFSGTMDYTSEAYKQAKTAGFEQRKKRLQALSVSLGVLGNMALPAVFYAALQAKRPGKLLQGVQKMLPHFNYHNVVFMSRYAILWHAFWNWNLPGLLLGRDNHERREHIAKSVAADFFFIFGDTFISGAVAKWFQKKHAKQLVQPNSTAPIKLSKKGFLGMPVGVELPKLYEAMTHGELKTLPEHSKKLLQKLGTIQFASGILGTSIALGLTTTLLNNWYTRKKVTTEQQQMPQQAKVIAPPIQQAPAWPNAYLPQQGF